jgi:hypothetical protein
VGIHFRFSCRTSYYNPPHKIVSRETILQY